MTIFYSDYHDYPPTAGDKHGSNFKEIYQECDAVLGSISHMPTRHVVSNMFAKLISEIERLNNE